MPETSDRRGVETFVGRTGSVAVEVAATGTGGLGITGRGLAPAAAGGLGTGIERSGSGCCALVMVLMQFVPRYAGIAVGAADRARLVSYRDLRGHRK